MAKTRKKKSNKVIWILLAVFVVLLAVAVVAALLPACSIKKMAVNRLGELGTVAAHDGDAVSCAE